MPLLAERRLQALVAARLDQVAWGHQSGPYQALDLRFGVRACDPALGEYLADVLSAFAVESSQADMTWFSALVVEDQPCRRLRAYVGGRRLVATRVPSLVPAYLLWALNQEVVGRATGSLLVHAAAAERDGAVVVLPGDQGSGKSTLVAGLLRRGYRYVTDEALAIDTATGRLRPYPKALSLEEGSWPLFPEMIPDLSAAQQTYAGAQWHIPAAHLGAKTMAPDAVPRVVLSPRYRAGAPTAVKPLRPAEGLVLLVENSFNGAGWGQRGLSAAAALVRGCPVIGELSIGNLEAACDLVDLAMDEAVTTTGAVVRDR
jgi:hypothetical protein